MTAANTTDVVLVIREGEVLLRRATPGIRVTILNYDMAEDLLRSGAITDDGTEWDGIGTLHHDERGTPYLMTSPAVTCAVCFDWIGDDEPRTSVGTMDRAASFCRPCTMGMSHADLMTALATV
jgi:hypothetical protein